MTQRLGRSSLRQPLLYQLLRANIQHSLICLHLPPLIRKKQLLPSTRETQAKARFSGFIKMTGMSGHFNE
jgi:hypothetical protein